MAQIAYRANLSATIFPLTVADAGRTVIVPGPDQNFDRRVDPTGAQKDAGIPQAMYLENVLPTANGYQSVGFINPDKDLTLPTGAHVWKVLEVDLYDFNEGKFVPAVVVIFSDGSSSGGAFGLNDLLYPGYLPTYAERVSTAIVRTSCYLYDEESERMFELSRSSGPLNIDAIEVSMTPPTFFTDEGIRCITGSNNYLIAASKDTIYWSSTTDQTDFTASLVSGAGFQQVNNANSAIQLIKQCPTGFYIYTDTNVILAQYTGNSRYPWRFIPVLNSNIVVDPYNQVWGTATSAVQFIIENDTQIKLLQGPNAEPAAPEVSNYLAKTNIQQIFNYATNLFTDTQVISINPRPYLHLNRYLFVSVRTTGTIAADAATFTYVGNMAANSWFDEVLIFDTLLMRYGKIRIKHTHLYTTYNYTVRNRENIVFLDGTTGTQSVLHFDIYETDTLPSGGSYVAQTGVFILGKLQYVRSRKIKLETLEIEGPQSTVLKPSPNFSCVLLPSLDGRNFSTPVPLTPSSQSGSLVTYPVHKTAENHSIICKGAFSINTIVVKFTPAGER